MMEAQLSQSMTDRITPPVEKLFARIVVDGTPVGKGRGKVGKLPNGRPVVFTPANTRKYETLVRQAAQKVVDGYNPLDCPVVVRVSAYLPIPLSLSKAKRGEALAGKLRPTTRPDIDNYVKSALDALNSVVFRDDNQVTDLIAVKRYSEKPRLEIEVFIC